MSCHRDQGTAVPNINWPFDTEEGDAASNSASYLQVMGPEDFSRTELRTLLDRVRGLAEYGVFSDTKYDLMVDLEETLDLLDALAAREETDLAELEETIEAHSQPSYVHVIHESPRCGPQCPMRFIGEA